MKDKNRKLTKSELERSLEFEKTKEKFKNQGYKKTDLTISVERANIQGTLIMVPIILIFLLLFFSINKNTNFSEIYKSTNPFLIFGLILFLIVIHELIHGLTWGFFTKDILKNIRFGVIWNMLTPYCTCLKPLSRNQYIIGAAMPTIILGILPFIISLINGNISLFLISLFMTFAGCGDLLIIINIIKHKDDSKEIFYLDHPTDVGLISFSK